MLCATIDSNGICTGVLQLDTNCARAYADDPGHSGLVELTQEDYDEIRKLPSLFRRDGDRWVVIDNNDYHDELEFRIPLDVRRSVTDHRKATIVELHRFGRDSSPPTVAPFIPKKDIPFLAHTFTNGVSVDHSTARHLRGIVDGMKASGTYPNLKDVDLVVDLWFRDKNGWFLTHSWRGQEIQYEYIQFDNETAHYGYTHHPMRERPSWFWRLHEQPVMEQLFHSGFKLATGKFMAKEADYVDALKSNFAGASLIGKDQNGLLRIQYDIEAVVNQVPYVPDRRTIDGWEFPQAGVSVAETTDILSAREIVQASWKGSSRTDEALRMFDERVHLDMATILVGRSNAVDPVVYVVRERTSDTSSMSCLVPWSDHPHHGLIAQGVIDWHAQVGYSKATTFWVPKRLDHPLTQKMMKRFDAQPGITRTYGGQTWHESIIDVESSMKRSSSSWAD